MTASTMILGQLKGMWRGRPSIRPRARPIRPGPRQSGTPAGHIRKAFATAGLSTRSRSTWRIGRREVFDQGDNADEGHHCRSDSGKLTPSMRYGFLDKSANPYSAKPRLSAALGAISGSFNWMLFKKAMSIPHRPTPARHHRRYANYPGKKLAAESAIIQFLDIIQPPRSLNPFRTRRYAVARWRNGTNHQSPTFAFRALLRGRVQV